MMDTPATPDPHLDARVAVLEEIAASTKAALVDIRAEMRALRSDTAADMRDMRASQRWLLGIMLGGFASLLATMAHGFHWL